MSANTPTCPPQGARRKLRRSSWRGWALLALIGAALTPSFAADAPKLPPLTTVSGSARLPGKFVWADLVTDDVPAARRFYAQMFGWRFRDVGSYILASSDDRPLCGMFQRPRPADRPQARPRWIGYLSVGSVERAQKAVLQAGGKVLAAPQMMPKRGEQALFADAEGAVFGVVKSSAGDPEDFLAEPGEWLWVQLLSRDAKQASAFYREVGGYEVIEKPADGRPSDYVLASKGYARATVRTIPPGREQVSPNWLPFVRVKNVSESVAQAKQLGGKVLLEPKPEFLHGQVAVIADPTGAAIGVMEWSNALMKGVR